LLSVKSLFRIPDPGVKKTPDPESGSATLLIGMVEKNKKTYMALEHVFVDERQVAKQAEHTGLLGSRFGPLLS
jgi:hypothetical protein